MSPQPAMRCGRVSLETRPLRSRWDPPAGYASSAGDLTLPGLKRQVRFEMKRALTRETSRASHSACRAVRIR